MTDISTLRADFKLAFANWRARGEISDAEAKQQITEAGSVIQAHLNDAEWMQCVANHFREIIAQHEQDRARSDRIKAEVRADRRAAKMRYAE